MNAVLKRLLLIATVILLFFIPNIEIPLVFNCLLLSLIMTFEIISKRIRFETMAFLLTYISMLMVHFLRPEMDILPRMPFFIYPILASMSLVSLLIRQPFTNGFHLNRGEINVPVQAWFSSIIWTGAFVTAGFSAYYFFPNHMYLLASFGTIAMAVVVNLFAGRISAS